MKVIKIILILFIALIVLFLSVGVINPSFEYSNTLSIRASADKCWTALTNPAEMDHWMNGLESYELIEGEHLKPGAVYSLTLADGGEKMEMKQRIADINPPTAIHYILTNDVLTSDFTYSLKEQNGNTIIESRYKVTGNSIFWSALLWLSKGHIQEESFKDLEKFKSVVEGDQ